jgi:methionine-rich copper-binding protein CopC
MITVSPKSFGDSIMPQSKRALRIAGSLAVVVALLVLARTLQAHAILKATSPVAHSTVNGPNIPVKLRFNVRIDAARSKLQLLHPDNSITDLAIEKQTAADTLTSTATGLNGGAYRIRWQVLAPDGHITRGEIPFIVAGS